MGFRSVLVAHLLRFSRLRWAKGRTKFEHLHSTIGLVLYKIYSFIVTTRKSIWAASYHGLFRGDDKKARCIKDCQC